MGWTVYDLELESSKPPELLGVYNSLGFHHYYAVLNTWKRPCLKTKLNQIYELLISRGSFDSPLYFLAPGAQWSLCHSPSLFHLHLCPEARPSGWGSGRTHRSSQGGRQGLSSPFLAPVCRPWCFSGIWCQAVPCTSLHVVTLWEAHDFQL